MSQKKKSQQNKTKEELPKVYSTRDGAFGSLPQSLEARMDDLFIELNSQPTAKGVIINYGTNEQIASQMAAQKQYIAFRKFDGSRIGFIKGGNKQGVGSTFFLVPSGADMPTP